MAICTSSLVMAQRQPAFKFSIGPELSIPTGNFSTGWSFGIGGTAQAEIKLQDNLNGTATTGIIFYNGKSLGGGVKNTGLTIIPIRVGGKYFFTEGIYGAAQIGVGILNRGFGTAFAYSPQLGYEFKTKSNKAIDATFKYDGYSAKSDVGTLGALGFRLAYIF